MTAFVGRHGIGNWNFRSISLHKKGGKDEDERKVGLNELVLGSNLTEMHAAFFSSLVFLKREKRGGNQAVQ